MHHNSRIAGNRSPGISLIDQIGIVLGKTRAGMTETLRDPTAKELAANFDIEKLTPEFYADPYPTYRALRELAPLKRLPNGGYFLTRYDDLVTAYKTTRAYSSDKKRSEEHTSELHHT